MTKRAIELTKDGFPSFWLKAVPATNREACRDTLYKHALQTEWGKICTASALVGRWTNRIMGF